MGQLVKFEYRKMWNRINLVVMIAMILVSSIYIMTFLPAQRRTIDADHGKMVNGYASYRALRDVSKDLEGEMNGKYLKKLVKKYNESYDKKYMDVHTGFITTAGMTKFFNPNYAVNFAHFSYNLSSGYESIGLNYDFLKSEESFYKHFKNATLEYQKSTLHQKLTPEREKILEKKVQDMKMPLYVGYKQGWDNIGMHFGTLYFVVLIAVAFTLSGLYAKDSRNGIDELTLAAGYGRSKDMKARWIAGNLFAATIYVVFVATIMMEDGIVATLDGWNVSIQIGIYGGFHTMNYGTYYLLHFILGLFGVLVMANLTLLVNIKLKNMKLSMVGSIIFLYIFMQWFHVYEGILWKFNFLNPLYFLTEDAFFSSYFIGKQLITYFWAFPVVEMVYMAAIYFFTKRFYRTYKMN